MGASRARSQIGSYLQKSIPNDKNLLWDELNLLKRELNVKIKTIDDYRLKSSMLG
jgi:hypothetical protein